MSRPKPKEVHGQAILSALRSVLAAEQPLEAALASAQKEQHERSHTKLFRRRRPGEDPDDESDESGSDDGERCCDCCSAESLRWCDACMTGTAACCKVALLIGTVWGVAALISHLTAMHGTPHPRMPWSRPPPPERSVWKLRHSLRAGPAASPPSRRPPASPPPSLPLEVLPPASL